MLSPALIVAAALIAQGPAKPFVSNAGGFRLTMPAVPREQTQKLQTPIGPIDLHMYLVDKGDTAYLATYSDYPEGVAQQDPSKLLDGVVDGSIKSSKGELITSKDIKLGTFPGREYDYKIPIPGGQTGIGRSRVYLVNSRLYQVVYIGTKEKSIPRAAEDYLKSFALTKAVAPVAKMPTPAVKKAATPAVGTKAFTSKEGGFTAMLPGAPVEQNQKVAGPAGPIDLHLFVVDKGDTAFFVSYMDIPKQAANPNTDQALENGVKGSIANTKGELVDKRDIRLGTMPGKAFEFQFKLPTGQPGMARSRIYTTGSRLYQLLYIASKDKDDSKGAEEFFKSFAITKAPTP